MPRWELVPTPEPALDEIVGMQASQMAEIYEAQRLTAQIIDLNVSDEVTQENDPMRIRLYMRDGLVVRATQSWAGSGVIEVVDDLRIEY